eukprot:5402014-Pyramimonas_sp.AAC.1
MALCIHGGRLPQTAPLPEKDVRVLDAGPLGQITFVHMNAQKKWLLNVRARGAAVADQESDDERDGEDGPKMALASASGATKRQVATVTPAKKQRTGERSSHHAAKTGLARGEAADRRASAVHCAQMPARSQLKFPDDKDVRHVR